MKKYVIAITILIAVLIFTAGCARQTPTPSDLDEVVITLERTACFGTCPVYKLTVRGDGIVIYEGLRFVKIEGTITTTINEEKIRQLVSEFQRIDYFSLKDSYEQHNATDMPSAITSMTINGKKKTVSHYHGDFSAPKQLTKLEDRIDEIVSTDKWVNRYLQ
jgi:hypothetical protein